MELENQAIAAETPSSETQEPQKKKHSWIGKIVLLAIVLIGVIVYFTVPAVKEAVNSIVAMFQTGNFAAMRSFIEQYGPYAMIVSSLLMIFQSLAAPLPAFFITLTNANLFGWWQGCILSFVSSMIGAAMCFYIARILGRDIVEKICTRGALRQIEDFFDKYGKRCILIARLLPFVSFDVVSYAAGLTSMGFWGFFLATGLGQAPACIVYSYVGGMLTGGAKMMFTGLLCLFALAILVVMIRSIWTSRQKAKAEKAAAEGVALPPVEKFNWTRFLNKFYNCSLWGMTVAMLCGFNAWLTMRVNQGWIFFGVWLLLLLIFGLIRKLQFGWKFTAINLVVCAVLSLIIFGMDKLAILPAAILREGIAQTQWAFSSVNIFMLCYLVIGLAAILFLNLKGYAQPRYKE